MKNIGFKLLLLFVITLFVVNCSVNKKRGTKTGVVVKSDNTSIEVFKDPSLEGFNLFEDSHEEKKWVDSIYNSLSFEEKLGQLFMVAAYSNKDTIHFNAIEKLVKNVSYSC